MKQSKGVLAGSGLFGEVAGAGGAIIALGARRGVSFGGGVTVFFLQIFRSYEIWYTLCFTTMKVCGARNEHAQVKAKSARDFSDRLRQ